MNLRPTAFTCLYETCASLVLETRLVIIFLHKVRSSRHRQRTSVASSLNWRGSMGKGKEPKKYRAHTKLARRKAWNKQNDQNAELHGRTLQVHIYQVPPAYMSLVEMWAIYFFASVDYRIPGVACQDYQMCSLVNVSWAQ